MDRFRQAIGNQGGLTPEQAARLEKLLERMPVERLQSGLARAFERVDPATLNQIAEKLAQNGATMPAAGKPDPATLALMAATVMRGRAGALAGVMMLLARSGAARDLLRQFGPALLKTRR